MRNTIRLYCAAMALAISIGMPTEIVLAQSQNSVPLVDTQTTTPLKPGDQIRLTVAGFPDLSGEQAVLSDGTIQLPMVGLLKVARLPPSQAVTLITNALKPYVRRPQVALSVVNFSPLRISITGEVLQPGPRLLNPFVQQNQQNKGTANGAQSSSPVTVSDALILAGGITPNADLRNVIIRRTVLNDNASTPGSIKTLGLVPGSNSSTAPTELTRTEIKVDLWKAIQSGDLAMDSRIYDGDEIVVLPAQLNNADQQTLLTSTVAPTKITVQVTGEVTRPGSVDVPPNAKVFDTIAAAGGTTDKANKRSVELFRMSPQGQLERQTFDLNKPSITVRNGDLLVVRKSGSSKFLDVLGQVFLPLYPVTTILNLFR